VKHVALDFHHERLGLPQPIREQRYKHGMRQDLLFLVCVERTAIGDVAERLFLDLLVATTKPVAGREPGRPGWPISRSRKLSWPFPIPISDAIFAAETEGLAKRPWIGSANPHLLHHADNVIERFSSMIWPSLPQWATVQKSTSNDLPVG
jgi:hypothetical protein